MNVNIICVGKLKEDYLRNACREYEKRLGAFCKLNIIELTPCRLPENPNPAQINAALEEEGERIISKINRGDAVFTLCIEGEEKSSEAFSKLLSSVMTDGASNIDFIIGGSFGLSDRVKAAGKYRLSFGKMTFPHQLARVMLLEQVYRAFMIQSGAKYHK
ncbi:MAG: 23S rRNA (pseudouridine(1915)-N(3))-methyltransferase RlmH [Clostridiales bacterium]|nr:23S rRNA (pseudouridine(1915)-N(3))-methyltransferase RlmH [Clostridiales bacterium]